MSEPHRHRWGAHGLGPRAIAVHLVREHEIPGPNLARLALLPERLRTAHRLLHRRAARRA